MVRSTVLWHRLPDPRHGYLRDYGLSCGHVLAHRTLVKGRDGLWHVPQMLTCPCCTLGQAPCAVVVPPLAQRTRAGWWLQESTSQASQAVRPPSEGALQPLPPSTGDRPGQRPVTRRNADWSPRDLAARNHD